LEKSHNQKKIRMSLYQVPSTLDQTYERRPSTISKQRLLCATHIVQWLVYLIHPFYLKEIPEVIANDKDKDPASYRSEIFSALLEMLGVCSSLITITNTQSKGPGPGPAQKLVNYANYSMREYLLPDTIWEGAAKYYSMMDFKRHNAIAKYCLKFLLQFQEPKLFPQDTKEFELVRYSAQFWTSHIQQTGESTEKTNHLALELLSADNPAYLVWIRSCEPDHPERAEPNLQLFIDRLPDLIYYAAHMELETVKKLLIQVGANVNAKGGKYGNAVQASAAKGRGRLAKLLPEAAADVNALSNEGSALSTVTIHRDKSMVDTPLAAGANIKVAPKDLEPFDKEIPSLKPVNSPTQNALCDAAVIEKEAINEVPRSSQVFRLHLYLTLVDGMSEISYVEIFEEKSNHDLFSRILEKCESAPHRKWQKYSLKRFQSVRFVKVRLTSSLSPSMTCHLTYLFRAQ
jgi:hypothetical protein